MPRADPSRKRCAIYTRKSSEEGLEQEFNSLEAQREACEAFIRSQRDEAGYCPEPTMTMVGSRAALWSGRRCNACSPTSGPAGSISSSSTRSTGKARISVVVERQCGLQQAHTLGVITRSLPRSQNRSSWRSVAPAP